ncbi:MAG: hypothetical protein ABIQ52_21465 [Vicinamibacterales bacterium]
MRTIVIPDTGQHLEAPRGRLAFAAVTGVSCALFAAHATAYLYFFVDDEAIPLVFARNLLRGRGFVYTLLEGRTEGFSDFLLVLWSAVVLGVTDALSLSRLSPLLIGKGLSFLAGVGVIYATARFLRSENVSRPGLVAGLGFLALSGPLAVWACSSLEAEIFALVVTAFTGMMLAGVGWRSVALGVTAVLLRLDGPIYVFTIALAVAAAIPHRRRNALRVIAPIGIATLLFHVWRRWYFHAWLSAPVAAKVLFRLGVTDGAMIKPPDASYVLGFVQSYKVVVIVVAVAALARAWRVPAVRACGVALGVLGLYVEIVGDWMFGWRFLVALLPLIAIVLALSVTRLPKPAAWSAALIVVASSGLASRGFALTYVSLEQRPLFWAKPAAGERAWLGRYYDLVRQARRVMRPGDRIAYNQAGLIPYLLDVENIDDLGICSRFVARLPTTDVFYTGVGRYSPLTNQPAIRTAHAYLLYHDVQFLLSPTDLLERANHRTIPGALLDDRFALVSVDDLGANAIYRRTEKPTGEYRWDPGLFRENVAHLSRVLHASIDGQPIAKDLLGRELPFLRELAATRSFTGAVAIAVTFAERDEDISALFIQTLDSQVASRMTLVLTDEKERETARRIVMVPAGAMTVYEPLPRGVRARAMTLTFDVSSGDGRITIADVRLEGQSPALRHYVRRQLSFRASPR